MESNAFLELQPEEKLLAALVRLSLRDAQQHHNPTLRDEARRWLWTLAPTFAAQGRIPRVAEDPALLYDVGPADSPCCAEMLTIADIPQRAGKQNGTSPFRVSHSGK